MIYLKNYPNSKFSILNKIIKIYANGWLRLLFVDLTDNIIKNFDQYKSLFKLKKETEDLLGKIDKNVLSFDKIKNLFMILQYKESFNSI